MHSAPQALRTLWRKLHGFIPRLLHTIGQTSIDPLKVVRNAWQSRLCARNAILFEREVFVHL